MKLENNKITFITIISGASLFLGLALIGICLKIVEYGVEPEIDPNPNRNFILDGKLYFYDSKNELIGTYPCQNTYCNYAYETINDNNYNFNYYKDGTIDTVKLVKERYVFLNDTAKIGTSESTSYYREAPVILFDLVANKKIKEYKAVKNYTVGVNQNIFFVQNKNLKWQILSLNGSKPVFITDEEYEFAGVNNNLLANNVLSNEIIVAMNNDEWELISANGNKRTNKINKAIYDYKSNYLIAQNEDKSYIMYTTNEYVLMNGASFKSIKFVGNYVAIINNNNEYMIMDFLRNTVKGEKISFSSTDVIREEVKDDQILVYVNDELKETV